MKPSAALATLRQIACLGYEGRMVLPSLIETLRGYVDFDISSLVFVNEQYQPVDSYTGVTRRPDLHALYLSKFFARLETGAMLSSGDLLRSNDSFDSTTSYGRRYYNSDFYDIICRPVDLHHGIRLALRDGRRPIACLVLSRPAGSRPFLAADEKRLLKAREFLCHALSKTENVEEAPMTPSGDTGLIIVDVGGRIQHISSEANRLLQMAIQPRLPLDAFADACYQQAREFLKPLVRQLVAINAGVDRPAPAMHLRNAWGGFSLRGYMLKSVGTGTPALVGVQIARHVPLPLKLLGLERVQSLPEREKEICLLLAQGHSTPTIAQMTKRSPHTVVSQVRSLYGRFAVSNRNELLSLLLGPDGQVGPRSSSLH
jgi:DNA-binding CsgD family transcriptional regulator